MGLFGNDLEGKALLKELREVSKKLDLGGSEGAPALTEEVVKLKKQISTLEIERDKREESFARQEREINHKIGLERQRSEQDAKNAVSEAKLAVREENLDAEKSRVKEQMEFMEKRLEQELDSMREMTSKVMDFIPKVEVDRRIREDYRDKPKSIESGDASSSEN